MAETNGLSGGQKSVLKGMAAILPTFILIELLTRLFPYTGLQRILAIPLILYINLALVAAAIFLTRKGTARSVTKLVWPVIILLTFITTIAFYPQESSPHVAAQIWSSLTALKNYNELKPEDMEKDDEETYVVALYKFRKEIPLDGDFYLYGRDDEEDEKIHTPADIPLKLYPHHRLMWRYLESSGR
ncbi:hypothetical protein DRW41_10005 [Neobacillus piezotolerans]|uniref:Uncharacterized protein n=1 Tax=Neobacillus piezotolerans TaxID=2259171 RepID=A0A3D8GRR6_9BACI|nr:hypothetical protein [Neobacillus piezotolerans]RDU37017.1 hypothetical protein DRW41_10005 [Neobacillus piezotolerans]